MSLLSGFFNSVEEDRLYDAEDLSGLLDGILQDGLLRGIGDEFEVVPETGMDITVGSGKSWHLSTWTYNTDGYSLTIGTSHPTMPRKDYVVIEVNKTLNVRANTLKVIAGTPHVTPVVPDLVDETTVKQYPLAEIYVAAGATSIGVGDITDTRDTVLCPMAEALPLGVSESQLSFSDVTSKNASASAHGLLPKLSGNSFDAFKGDGTWGTAGAIPVTNKSGGALEATDVVIWDKTNGTAVKTTTIFADPRCAGVVLVGGANDATIYLVPYGTMATVKVQGNVYVGQALVTSSTEKRAESNGAGKQTGFIGYSLTEFTGTTGTVTAIIAPSWDRFGGSPVLIGSPVAGTLYWASTPTDQTVIASFSTSGSNRLLLVLALVNSTNGGITSMKFGTTVMSSLVSGTGSTTLGAHIYYLLNPDIATQALKYSSNSSGGYVKYVAMMFNDVNQTTPLTAGGGAGAASGTSLSVAGVVCPGSIAIGGFVSKNGNNTPSTRGQVLLEGPTLANPGTDGTSETDKLEAADASNKTFTWTVPNSAVWAAALCGINPL